jgi:UDP-3-O-[3-hydroxymyristoyl] glucosamine N-acyltransferase
MKVSAAIIANIVNGVIEGNKDVEVFGPSGIEYASEGHITFLGNDKYEHHLYTTMASVVLVPQNLVLRQEISATLIRVDNVYQAVSVLLSTFEAKRDKKVGISNNAIVEEDVVVGGDVSVGHGSVIEKNTIIGDGVQIGNQVWIGAGCIIGSGTVIDSGVKIYHQSQIGKNCTIQANAIIGSEGFGYTRDAEGVFTKVPQIGIVILEDDVEIGANACIDRATMGVTRLKKGVKVDNLVHVAHNVIIGQHTAIAAQAGIAGSAKIGQRCLIGGQVGIAGHIIIADESEFQAQSGVASSIVDSGKKWFGYPAIEYMKYIRSYSAFKKLPQLMKTIFQLEKKVKALEDSRNLDK